jgi:hypothetical protein
MLTELFATKEMQRTWEMAFFCDLRTRDCNCGYFTVCNKKMRQREKKWVKMAFDLMLSACTEKYVAMKRE